jgi:glucosamine--fructose-6-phosphate aminotransferase (isomerizing)
MPLRNEILEQPAILRHLFSTGMPAVEQIASELSRRQIDYVFLAARGTSDNAGLYAKYLWGANNHLPVALATPSLFTMYEQPPRLDHCLVVGISQSGQSPDIVGVLAEGKRQGAPTLAFTNDPASPLASVADHVIYIQAGVEAAVAATKTYTAELMAIAMLSIAMGEDPTHRSLLAEVPGWARQVLEQEPAIAQAAARYRFMQQCVVLGRGYNYSTAYEWSLKLKELAYIHAEPYSSADFLHGPIAMVERGFPVLAIAPSGRVFQAMLDLLDQLREQQKAELLVISDQQPALSLAQTPISLPADIPEWLTPLVGILPAQLFAYYLTRERGYNTESPRSIRKVTETR